MTHKEELEQKAKEAVELVCGRVGRNADIDESDQRECIEQICAMFFQVEREVLQKVIASVKTQIDIYDSLVEGCDADEFALYNSMTAELSKFIRWLRTQQQELI